jgi:hypothetical protein
MGLWGGMILRAGITWGIVAILLAIIGIVLAPILPTIEGLTLATFAFIMAGVHYSAKANQADLLGGGLGGALAGGVAAILLVLIRFIPLLNLPSPGAPADLLVAILIGLIAGAAGGLAFKAIVR